MIGGFLLTLFLGPIGFIIIMCIGNDSNKKGAAIALAIYIITAIILTLVISLLTR